MFMIRPRLGIGFDIEHNEDIIYRVHTVDERGREEECLFCYNGMLLKLPFFTIYVGDFADLREVVENENSSDN